MKTPKELLQELYAALGSDEKIAAAIGTHQTTVSRFRRAENPDPRFSLYAKMVEAAERTEADLEAA